MTKETTMKLEYHFFLFVSVLSAVSAVSVLSAVSAVSVLSAVSAVSALSFPIYPIRPILPIKQQFIEKSPHFLLIIGLSFVTLHVVYVYIYNNGHKPPTFAQNTKQTIIH